MPEGYPHTMRRRLLFWARPEQMRSMPAGACNKRSGTLPNFFSSCTGSHRSKGNARPVSEVLLDQERNPPHVEWWVRQLAPPVTAYLLAVASVNFGETREA